MKFMQKARDGGPHSTVTGFFFIEIKSLFSIVLLRFANGSREAYHSHAFNCISWVLKGELMEHHYDNRAWNILPPRCRLLPFLTRRSTFHKVVSNGTSWVFSIRGPWVDRWREYLEAERRERDLTHGRVEVHDGP